MKMFLSKVIIVFIMQVMLLSATTSGGVSSVPPKEFSVAQVGLTSITVKWKTIPEGSWNGALSGYLVRYKKLSHSEFTYSNAIGNVIQAQLNNLEKDTFYSIQVAGDSIISGVGVYSQEIITRTKEYDPCGFPCLNGGTCVEPPNNSSNSFYCTCAMNFTGEFCASYISDIPCNSPNVSLPNVSPYTPSDFRIHRSSQFIIQSEVSLNCELSHRTMFLWSVYQLEEDIPVLSRNSSSELRITPRSLPVGVYLVKLTVNMRGTPVFGVSQGYFQVASSPLVASIAGGSKVARGLNRTLIFDASMSYDPDEENQQFSGLNFTWLCRKESLLDQAGCYRAGDKESAEHELRVNNSVMVENTSYFITVLVTKDQRHAEYTQEVFFVPGDPPEVQIRCVENCDVKLNPSGRMALQGICAGASCGGTLIYKWSVFKDTNNTSNHTQWTEMLEVQHLISTRMSSKSLVTKPAVLMPNVRYKFILTAQRQGGYPGYSEYHVITNSPPAGGTCGVSPSSGVTLTTEFTFTCSNWQDPDLPLQYEFIYQTNNNLLNVVYKGVKTSVTTKLPAGEKTNNFTIDFRVRVADMFGTFTEVRTPVQVTEPSIEPASLVDVVTNLTTGDESGLTSLIQSGDVSRAIQLATAAIAVVDAIAQAETGESQVHELREKITMMKSSIIQQFSAIPAETVVRVQQVSNVIASASSVISEVTVEAQKDATDALQKMTIVLKTESTAGESYDMLFDGAKSLVTGLGSMLRVASHGARVYDPESQGQSQIKASFMAANARPSHKSRGGKLRTRTSYLPYLLARRTERNADYGTTDAQLQSQIHVGSIFHSLEEVGSTILSRTLVGEKPRDLSSQSVSLLVSREEPSLLAGSVLSNKGNSFTLPSVPNLFSNVTQFIDSQMVTTDFTPFSWDPSGARVTTGVSSLELKNSTGHLLNTRELTAPISIKLQNPHDVTNTSQSYYIGANRTVFYKINVTQSEMALILKVRPQSNKTEFLVTVKYGERSSLSNGDFNVTIPDHSSCVKMPSGYLNCSRDPYVVFLKKDFVEKKGLGYYFIGVTAVSRISGISRVRRCPGHGRSKRTCVQYKEPPITGASYHEPDYRTGDENYTMQVIQAACLFWNAEISQWTSEGCEVSEITSQDAILCSCNHLSAFGGQLFVAPNPVDFDKVFTELTRLPDTGNIAVIIAVSSVFGLYLLLLLWARKNDKLDLLKVGEKAQFLGVPSPWSRFVEVQVSTGIWRNSGTTANVFIILEGELGTSRPYHLKDESCIPFARGSIISFILSIPVNIGPIRTVRVWHDNSGTSPAWFLNHIKVCDLSSQEQWNFVCFTWLAVDKGDGLINRTLNCSSTADKSMDFAVYAQNRIAGEFSDAHLWFSVATRPPRYRFTRVQRLTCCLSLMLTTMLASAMFYEYDTGAEDTQGSLRLGRFVINLREFIIGLQSLVVILPANILIVELFTRTRSSIEDRQLETQSDATKKPIKKEFSFPHWFVFVPWLLCFQLSVGTAAFVIFYSLQWGADTSKEWLVSVAMTILIDIVVSEPLKVIVVAFMLSRICKAGIDRSSGIPYLVDTVVDADDIKLSGLGNEEEEVEIPKPLSKKQLRRARTTGMREMYMYTVLRNMMSYILYLLILSIVCYGGRSKYGYMMTSSMKNTFGELNMISNHLSAWDWVRDVLVPGLFEDGKDATLTSSSPYVGDGDAVLVGMPRLRQLRVKEDSCDVIDQVKSLFSSCVASYASSNEDKTSFHQSSWRVFPPSNNGSLSILYQICPSAWNYSSAKQTQSLPLWGRLHLLNIYSEGGYLAELGYDKSTALRVVSELNLFDWIDRFTSAVIVEFTVFNSRVNLFSMSWIPIEFSPSGHVISNHVIRTMHIYDIGGGYSAVTIACQLLLVVYIIYFVVKETKQMIADIRLYFSQFLNWVELTQTVTVIGFVITHILKETELFANTAKLSKNTFQFIGFDKGVLLDDMETVLLSLLMFLNTLKLLHLLKFNPHVRHLFYVMKASARELIHCSLGLAVFMCASIHVGYLLFGRELYSFSSPFITLQSLLVEGVVGDGVDHFCDCCIIIGPVYLTALKLGLNVLGINIFICVLIYNYSTIRKLPKGTYDVGHFMIVKIKEVLRWMGDSLAMNADISAHAECNTIKADVPNTKMEENTLDAVDDILTKLDRINHLLNVLYADEFGEDCELFSLWFDLHMQAKKSASKDAQESDEDEEEQWEDAQAYFALV